jgi:hypothetical protein
MEVLRTGRGKENEAVCYVFYINDTRDAQVEAYIIETLLERVEWKGTFEQLLNRLLHDAYLRANATRH